MRKLTPTLTQGGLLAVLLQRQRDKISQLALRRAQPKHMCAALWSTLTWPWRALAARGGRPAGLGRRSPSVPAGNFQCLCPKEYNGEEFRTSDFDLSQTGVCPGNLFFRPLR